jgi:DNA topoisomerase IA
MRDKPVENTMAPTYSAKTTLSIAQSLYESHKALTYPRTDSRALPEDYLPVEFNARASSCPQGIP